MTVIETTYVRGRKPRTVIDPRDRRHHYSPKIASLLGHMTIHWASLEFAVQLALWQITETHEIGEILTRQLGMRRWLDDLYLVARKRIKDDSTMEEMTKITRLIEAAQARRNDFVHGLYAATNTAGTAGQVRGKPQGKKLRRAFKVEIKMINTKELDKLIKDIHAAETKLHNWIYKYVENLNGPLLPPLRHSMKP